MRRWGLLCLVLSIVLFTGCFGVGDGAAERRAALKASFEDLMEWQSPEELLAMHTDPVTIGLQLKLYAEEVTPQDVSASIWAERDYTHQLLAWKLLPSNTIMVMPPWDEVDDMLVMALLSSYGFSPEDWEGIFMELAAAMGLVIEEDFFTAQAPVHSANATTGKTVIQYQAEYQYEVYYDDPLIDTSLVENGTMYDGSVFVTIELSWKKVGGDWLVSAVSLNILLQEETPLRNLQGFSGMLFGLIAGTLDF